MTAEQSGHPASRVAPDITDRLAGAAGLLFVAVLIVDNALRSQAPGAGAAPAKVIDYLIHHRAASIIPLALFPIALIALLVFVGGLWARIGDRPGQLWVRVGVLGTAAIVVFFGIVNAVEIALTARAKALGASPDLVQALWAVHAAAFALTCGAIAAALLGLSQGARAAQLIPGWMGAVAIVGAILLLVPAVFSIAVVNGGPWIALGIVGFLIWGVFLAVVGVSLLRGAELGGGVRRTAPDAAR